MAVRNNVELVAVGPRHPTFTFPLWYQDSAGTRLCLGLDRLDPRLPAIGEPPKPPPAAPFPPDFPDEAFYWLAVAEVTIAGGPAPGRARLILGLEAAFGGTGAVVDGQQIVFGRVRVRIDGAVPGAEYVIIHPYGQTDALPADDRGRVFVTEDLGGGALDFAGALHSQIGPFLRWTADPALPAGYLGDGVTEHLVTGSPFGTNLFRVSGPDVGGPGVDSVETALFTVQGREATVFGVEPTRVVYARNAGGAVLVDVFATSTAGAQIEATAATGGAGMVRVALQETGGRFHGRLDTGQSLPATVDVANVSDVPVTLRRQRCVDAVTVGKAEYDTATGTLTVEATSSDAHPTPPLQADGIGPLLAGTLTQQMAAPPAEVLVTSSQGGSGRRDVSVVGPALPDLGPVAPAARILVNPAAPAGAEVNLDGRTSTGATGFAWSASGPGGAPISVVDADLAQARFTMPATGPVTVQLTVSGPGGPDATVTAVVDLGTDTLQVVDAQFRTSSRRWRVRGTATGRAPDTVTVSLGGDEVGSALVDVTGAWDVRRTLDAAEAAPPIGSTVHVTSSQGGDVDAGVTIRS